LAYALGPVSGCHVNPAVTMGALLACRLPLVEAADGHHADQRPLGQMVGGRPITCDDVRLLSVAWMGLAVWM
jgi:glycerol uptake facilitator-like aquaporin